MSKSEITREEMLKCINEFINPGCPYGLPMRRKLKAIRRLIEKVGEWQEKIKILAAVEPYNEAMCISLSKMNNLLQEIRDFGKEGK